MDSVHKHDLLQDPMLAFGLDGDTMRRHVGRSVVRIDVDGTPHYLKRFWLTPGQILRRYVAQGLRELEMIDWLNTQGFRGPRVVARGCTRVLGVRTKAYFLMEEVAGERPLEHAWQSLDQNGDEADGLIHSLARFAVGLHDAGFTHTDFSERHILVGRDGAAWTFRLIDLERASVGRPSAPRAAADIKTLMASILDGTLRERIAGDFLDTYIARRGALPRGLDFRSLVENAKATKAFY